MSGTPISLESLARELTSRAPELARQLLPGGHQEGPEWVAPRRKDGGPGDSLKIRIKGPRMGVWFHGAAGEQGDALSLIAYLLYNGDIRQAIRWARAWLGCDELEPARQLASADRSAAAEREKRAQDSELARARRAGQYTWLQAQASIAGTPADRYLKGRGLDLGRLGRQPGALRFDPACFDGESQRRWPALLCAAQLGSGAFGCCHRIFLEVQADGSVKKAPLEAPKKASCSFRGAFIRIWRGDSGQPLAKAPLGSAITVTEGVEDALAIAIASPAERVVSSIALSNMANLSLGERIATVVIAKDNDPGNPSTARALDRAIAAFFKRGYAVKIATPPEGVHDFNDLLLGGQ